MSGRCRGAMVGRCRSWVVRPRTGQRGIWSAIARWASLVGSSRTASWAIVQIGHRCRIRVAATRTMPSVWRSICTYSALSYCRTRQCARRVVETKALHVARPSDREQEMAEAMAGGREIEGQVTSRSTKAIREAEEVYPHRASYLWWWATAPCLYCVTDKCRTYALEK